jgi:hypothetical protein
MTPAELLEHIHAVSTTTVRPLTCTLAGHASGHVCVPTAAPDDGTFRALLPQLRELYGRPRNLAMNGDVDPTVTARTGLPLLTAFDGGEERVVELRAWPYRGRWIGCGTVQNGDVLRTVVLVADRFPPRAGGVSWVERIVDVTGWDAAHRALRVDWASVESRLGTALPADYKELAERFGHGAFDDYLELVLPERTPGALDLVSTTEFQAECGNWWAPYGRYPSPGGLLQWAGSEQEQSFYWITEGDDPDRWPVYVTDVDPTDGERCDYSASEFVCRVLTEPHHPCSTAQYFDTHHFTPYDIGA